MSLDSSITRLAFRETDNLSVAQVLVAKKRAELELELLRDRAREADGTAGAVLDSTVRDMRAASEALVPTPSPGTSRVDRRA